MALLDGRVAIVTGAGAAVLYGTAPAGVNTLNG